MQAAGQSVETARTTATEKRDPRGKGPNHRETTRDDSSRSYWATAVSHAVTKWAAITIGAIMIAGIITTWFVGAVPPTPAAVRKKRTGEHGPIPEPTE